MAEDAANRAIAELATARGEQSGLGVEQQKEQQGSGKAAGVPGKWQVAGKQQSEVSSSIRAANKVESGGAPKR